MYFHPCPHGVRARGGVFKFVSGWEFPEFSALQDPCLKLLLHFISHLRPKVKTVPPSVATNLLK